MRNSQRPSMSQSRRPALHNSFIKNASQHWALLSHIPNMNTLWLATSLIPMSRCRIYRCKYFRIPIRLSKQNSWHSVEIARQIIIVDLLCWFHYIYIYIFRSDLKSLKWRKVVTRKYETAGKLLIYQLDSYSIVYAGFEYRMMVIGFSFYITVKKKKKCPGGNELKRHIKNKITLTFWLKLTKAETFKDWPPLLFHLIVSIHFTMHYSA